MKRLIAYILRSIASVSGAVLLSLLFGSTAGAHVTVHPGTLPAGSHDVELTFRCPNERDSANTVGLQVYFPTNLPLLTVDVLPVPGWTSKVDTKTLSTPIQTDDGSVSQIVTDVNWTASTGGIAPAQYEDFSIAVGSMPSTAGTLIFKSLQTYSSGEVVRWIQVAAPQDPNPDSPAPTLTLTSGATAGAASSAPNASSSTTVGLAIAALVVAVIGLAGVVLLALARRRDSDPPQGL